MKSVVANRPEFGIERTPSYPNKISQLKNSLPQRYLTIDYWRKLSSAVFTVNKLSNFTLEEFGSFYSGKPFILTEPSLLYKFHPFLGMEKEIRYQGFGKVKCNYFEKELLKEL